MFSHGAINAGFLGGWSLWSDDGCGFR